MKSIIKIFELLKILINENYFKGSFERLPEPSLVMDESEQVLAWHSEGKKTGEILPVYHLCAKACSAMIPFGGTVVDLACGSGRFAIYLALQRPDIKIIGFDLSDAMIEIGNLEIKSLGLFDRIELRHGDLTSFAHLVPKYTSLITSIFAIHHLPSKTEVEKCFQEFKNVQEETDCSFFLFDLARPKHKSSAKCYTNIFTSKSSPAFKQDTYNSLLAAFTPLELYGVMLQLFPENRIRSAVSNLIPFYQALWFKNDKKSKNQVNMQANLNQLSYKMRIKIKALAKIIPISFD